MIKKNKQGVYHIAELLSQGLIHGFSPKTFGNMSVKYGPETEVAGSRDTFCRALGTDYAKTARMDLVHGTKVAVVEEAGLVPDTDGLITSAVGLPLWLLTGDCSPIIFYDPKMRVTGVAHAGWRGTVGKLPTIMFAKMVISFGCQPENILVGIGPSIEKCHYIKQKPIFPENFPEWKNFLTPVGENKLAIDLNGFTVSQLMAVGAKKKNILYSSFCVADHNDEFFSQQMEKAGKDKPGRFATVVLMT